MELRSFLLSFLMLFSLFDVASSGPVSGGACAAACTVALGSCHVAATMSAMVGRADYSEAKKACDVIFCYVHSWLLCTFSFTNSMNHNQQATTKRVVIFFHFFQISFFLSINCMSFSHLTAHFFHCSSIFNMPIN
ncbi:hypothetical protein M3Y94_00707100 [Aphelenchoides besseyi]|nr:hypothetical protein M3Y94_00707100 [Aphelenchoides besseyi]